jgi:hypothetical protein
MKDNVGNEIYQGDIIELVNCHMAIDGMLSLVKQYAVIGLREDEGRVVIIDDRGLEGWYRSDRFVTRQHFSELP